MEMRAQRCRRTGKFSRRRRACLLFHQGNSWKLKPCSHGLSAWEALGTRSMYMTSQPCSQLYSFSITETQRSWKKTFDLGLLLEKLDNVSSIKPSTNGMGNFTAALYYKCSFHDRIHATHLRVWTMQPVDQVSWMMTASHAFVRQVLLERYAMKVKLCSVTGIFELHDIISLIDRWICFKKASGCPQLD